jgi:hypothetical protein
MIMSVCGECDRGNRMCDATGCSYLVVHFICSAALLALLYIFHIYTFPTLV